MVKRINFDMADECAALLKATCVLKGTTMSAHIYDLVAQDFRRLVFEDPQVREMFLASEYPPGSKADLLKREYLLFRESQNVDP